MKHWENLIKTCSTYRKKFSWKCNEVELPTTTENNCKYHPDCFRSFNAIRNTFQDHSKNLKTLPGKLYFTDYFASLYLVTFIDLDKV